MANSLFSEYRNSLKNPFAEELIDLVFYRPLAFLFVKFTLPLPLTPNMISLLAMLFGILAGAAFSQGSAAAFLTGGVLFGFSNVLDCMDGMIARLKKNGTRTGRIVDGLVDYIASIAVYVGLGIGLSKAGALPVWLPWNPWLLLVVAGVSSALHAIASDKYRNAFIRQQKTGGTAPEEDEYALFVGELARLQKSGGHLFDRMLIRIYLRYLAVQKKNSGNKKTTAAPEPIVSPTSVVLWNLIGPSTRISAIIIAALLYKPAFFFIFTIVVCNGWMLLLYGAEFLQKKLKAPARDIAA